GRAGCLPGTGAAARQATEACRSKLRRPSCEGQVRAAWRGDRLRPGRERPRRSLPPGLQPGLRMPRGTVLGMQVLPDRRRRGAEALLELRAVRFGAVERLLA